MIRIKYALEDVMLELAQDVFDRHEQIEKDSMEGLLDDDTDAMEDNINDILQSIIEEKLDAS